MREEAVTNVATVRQEILCSMHSPFVSLSLFTPALHFRLHVSHQSRRDEPTQPWHVRRSSAGRDGEPSTDPICSR
jgi:hypothetical protein